jgi:hypothetical protein
MTNPLDKKPTSGVRPLPMAKMAPLFGIPTGWYSAAQKSK